MFHSFLFFFICESIVRIYKCVSFNSCEQCSEIIITLYHLLNNWNFNSTVKTSNSSAIIMYRFMFQKKHIALSVLIDLRSKFIVFSRKKKTFASQNFLIVSFPQNHNKVSACAQSTKILFWTAPFLNVHEVCLT